MSAALADCKFDAGVLEPVIDRNRCEAKGPCVEACPVQVFVLRPITAQERAALGLKGRIKAWAHGSGLCVAACPEHAITLRRRLAA